MTDYELLRELVGRYARCLDRGDVNGVIACCLPTARFRYDDGKMELTGTAELQNLLDRALTAPSTHLIGNYGIQLDGDTAQVFCSALVVATRETPALFRGLEYELECARTGDGWRISRLAHSVLWELRLNPQG